MRHAALVGALALGVIAESATPAWGSPRPLPFTYTTETLGQGEMEFEQFADLTPVKAYNAQGVPSFYAGTQFQTEFEYGITDRLELGLYIVYVPTPAEYQLLAPMTENTGTKQRLRYVLADPGEWPVDVGLYGEIVEGQTEFEFEGKVLLQRRVGNLRIDANLWAELELEYSGEKSFVINPTLGATYEITPAFHLGVESWLRAEYPDEPVHPRPFAYGPAAYVGPAVLLNFGKLWWSTGLYARVSDVDHSMRPGEPYGPYWGRTIVGLEL